MTSPLPNSRRRPSAAPAWVDEVAGSRLSRRALLGLGGGLAGLALTACSSGSDNSTAAVAQRHADGVLRVAIAAAPANINPTDSGSEVSRWIAEPIVETLYQYDASLKSVPLLATGMPEVSADQLTWTIPLRDDVTWHNGDRFTAHDVVATLGHIADFSAGSEWVTYVLGFVSAWTALDDHTVEIRLSKPYGLLQSHLTNLPISHKDFANRKDAMMGTGPFKLDSYQPGQTFTLSAFPDYHGEKPSIKGIIFTTLSDGSTRLVNLKQGKIDLITAVPYRNIGSAREDQNLVVHEIDAPQDLLTYVNMKRAPFNDEKFRRAVAVSMDREGVVQKVFGGAALPGQGPAGPAELGHDARVTPYAAKPDLAKAAEYLAASSVTERSFTITIGTSQTTKDIAEVLVAGWAAAGITVTIEQLTGGDWSNKLVGVTYDMILNLFQSGFTSGPANYMTMAPADSTNVLSCGYANPEVDALFQTVWASADESEREQALVRINKILADDAVIFPAAYPKLVLAHRKEVSSPDPDFLRISRILPQHLRLGT